MCLICHILISCFLNHQGYPVPVSRVQRRLSTIPPTMAQCSVNTERQRRDFYQRSLQKRFFGLKGALVRSSRLKKRPSCVLLMYCLKVSWRLAQNERLRGTGFQSLKGGFMNKPGWEKDFCCVFIGSWDNLLGIVLGSIYASRSCKSLRFRAYRCRGSDRNV
ncbi:hypothetical protein JOM56_001516 [Amanita muscaria]